MNDSDKTNDIRNDENFWIAWPGGDMPVRGDTAVFVKFRFGDDDLGDADYYVWTHDGDDGDIIGYRVSKGRDENVGPSHDDGNLWITWPGGDMPVRARTEVFVKFRRGNEDFGDADEYIWTHDGDDGDIIAYRISSNCDDDADSLTADESVLTGAELHRAIANAIDAGESASCFEIKHRLGEQCISEEWTTVTNWRSIYSALFCDALVRRKPRTRGVTLDDGTRLECPSPMTNAPTQGYDYWVIFSEYPITWTDDLTDFKFFNQRGCFRTREDKEQAERFITQLFTGRTL